MSIFGSIAKAIFGGSAHAAPVTSDSMIGVPINTPAAAPGSPAPAPAAAPAAAAPGAATAATAKMAAVDVADVLDGLTDESDDDDLDWRKSIVDLMKLLKLDSSLKSRKSLAEELHYSGDMGDSASMNVWLHKQVMTKLAENGGVVPKDLTH
jgi:3-oxoacyl-ACP reductase-like protein